MSGRGVGVLARHRRARAPRGACEILGPMILFSMLHASVITAAEEIWRMWCVGKEVGRVRLYLVPSRPRFLHPARRAANLNHDLNARIARLTTPPKISTTTATILLLLVLMPSS